MYVEMHQELERSAAVPRIRGRETKLNGEANDDTAEVGSAHSSLRAGKPFLLRALSIQYGEGADSYIWRVTDT